jgi:hypothetical protein
MEDTGAWKGNGKESLTAKLRANANGPTLDAPCHT